MDKWPRIFSPPHSLVRTCYSVCTMLQLMEDLIMVSHNTLDPLFSVLSPLIPYKCFRRSFPKWFIFNSLFQYSTQGKFNLRKGVRKFQSWDNSSLWCQEVGNNSKPEISVSAKTDSKKKYLYKIWSFSWMILRVWKK
jgi:hypothetical protein